MPHFAGFVSLVKKQIGVRSKERQRYIYKTLGLYAEIYDKLGLKFNEGTAYASH